MVRFRLQNAGEHHNLMTANKSFQNVTKLKYFETTVASRNCILQEIKSRINSGYAYFHSIPNL